MRNFSQLRTKTSDKELCDDPIVCGRYPPASHRVCSWALKSEQTNNVRSVKKKKGKEKKKEKKKEPLAKADCFVLFYIINNSF